MDENNGLRIIKSAVVIVLGITIGIAVFAVLIIAFSTYMENAYKTPTEYFYSVSIRDLNGASTSGGVEILLPMPCINGVPVFSDAELTGSYGNWQSSVVTTDAGRMISLRNPNEVLNDIAITYYRRSYDQVHVSAASDVYLSPGNETENQSIDDIRNELRTILKNSEHSSLYHSSDAIIDYSLNNSQKNSNLYKRYTRVAFRGGFTTPRFRAISIDLDFNIRGYSIRSYTVMNETDNVTVFPVAISGI